MEAPKEDEHPDDAAYAMLAWVENFECMGLRYADLNRDQRAAYEMALGQTKAYYTRYNYEE